MLYINIFLTYKAFGKMPMNIIMCYLVVMFSSMGRTDDSFVRDVTLDKKLVDSETSEIFNKTLASKDSSKFLRGARTPPTPPSRVMPSYSPPSRAFFTPPLPPEYVHPFADKPTLRGSNSESNNLGNRRPIPPPPPHKVPPGELIPIRPPDLVPHDTKKKTLNTPSFKKVAEPVYSETSSTTSANRVNETFDFVPILPYPSVSRILASGANGRKHDIIQDIIERTRLEHDKEPRTIKQEVKSLIPPVSQDLPQIGGGKTEVIEEERDSESRELEQEEEEDEEKAIQEMIENREKEERKEKQNEEAQKQKVINEMEKSLPQTPGVQEPRRRQILGVAWDIHVYLVAILFAVLAVGALFNLLRIPYSKHLLSPGYYFSLHLFLFTIGIMRSFYLFYDAYNISQSLPEAVSSLLLNMVFPLLTSSFAILFLYLAGVTQLKGAHDSNSVQKAVALALFIFLHLVLTFSVYFYSAETPYAIRLPLVCQCVFIIICLGLGFAYLYTYKSMSSSCGVAHYGGPGIGSKDCERWSLAHAVRVTLATAMLSILMAVLHLSGMLGLYEVLGDSQPQPWLWWGFQLSVRVVEIAMCFLICWAGAQGQSPELARQPPSAVDDLYPAICTANPAYTLRSNKSGHHHATGALYDDTYPLNSLHRAPKKHPTLERRLQPSPSMLVAENGFVRFRTIADSDLPDDPPYHPPSNSIHDYA